MKLLVIGNGAREHALCFALNKSAKLTKLYAAPGNPGIASLAECILLDINKNDQVVNFCLKNDIDLVIIGPEQPLVNGLVNDLNNSGILAFGPTKEAALLESSKSFTKELCNRYNIPTAFYKSFDQLDNAVAYLLSIKDFPIVIKVDGLAAGKGVIIANSLAEAQDAVKLIFNGKFGEAGKKIIIEEFLQGPEVSFFTICDGKSAIYFGAAQDHKRAYDNDQGPNTGGMGSFAPSALINVNMRKQIMETIIQPTLQAMQANTSPFKGVLFAGLILTKNGPYLLEYNCRFGDPETESLMMLLESDLLEIMLKSANGDLQGYEAKFSQKAAVTVVMASKGYPGDYVKGTTIIGAELVKEKDVMIFHASTTKQEQRLIADGGRVLAITAVEKDIEAARNKAYLIVKSINWPEGFYRNDIASKQLPITSFTNN